MQAKYTIDSLATKLEPLGFERRVIIPALPRQDWGTLTDLSAWTFNLYNYERRIVIDWKNEPLIPVYLSKEKAEETRSTYYIVAAKGISWNILKRREVWNLSKKYGIGIVSAKQKELDELAEKFNTVVKVV